MLEFARRFVGIPYKLGSFNPEEGLDCATFVLHFFKTLDGKELSIDFPGDIFDVYAKNHSSKVYEKYIQKCLYLQRYPCETNILDILVFNEKERHSQHVGIYLGNGAFIHCNEYGVNLFKVSMSIRSLLFVGKFKEGVR